MNNFVKEMITKITTQKIREIGATPGYYWGALDKWDFFEVIS
jgi:hypothetical protein